MWCKQLTALKALVQHLEARVDELKEQGNMDVSLYRKSKAVLRQSCLSLPRRRARVRGAGVKVTILNIPNITEREKITL